MKRTWRPFQRYIEYAFFPLIWLHEYCHYWTAQRLGLLARIQGARTHVHQAKLPQHILIAIAPTVPSLTLFAASVYGYLRYAHSPSARINLGALVVIAALVLLSCAGDWRVILASLLDPSILVVDSFAILLISAAPPQELDIIRTRLETLGYFTDWGRSGAAALNAIRRNPFNLIVVDANVPDLDLNTLHMELDLQRAVNGTRILPLRTLDELAKLPLYLEIGLPEDRFIQ